MIEQKVHKLQEIDMGVTELETDGCLGIAMFFHTASPSHQSKAKQRVKGKSTLLHEIGTSLNCKIQRSFPRSSFFEAYSESTKRSSCFCAIRCGRVILLVASLVPLLRSG